MNSISNDFVTIKYSSEVQKKIAEYYMNIFNEEPDYFKCILGKKNTIYASKLPDITNNNESNRTSIIEYILENNNAKNIFMCGDIPTKQDVYCSMMNYFHDDPSQAEKEYDYHTLAYDYFRMTGNFSYLKKYYFEGELSQRDMRDLCMYEVENCYEELLKFKIDNIRKGFSYSQIIENLEYIRTITEYTDALATKALREAKNKKESYRISKKEFNNLVIGVLNYIDPTNKIVEEYLKAKKEGHINLIYNQPDNLSSYSENRNQDYELEDWDINIYMTGTLDDIRDLVHEFGHYYYRKNNKSVREHNHLFCEYPSIYFEYKAIEYLETIGFTKDQVLPTKVYRMIENKDAISDFLPSLYCIECNKGKDSEYHIKEVDEYARNYWVREFKRQMETSTPEEQERLHTVLLFFDRVRTLSMIDVDEKNLKYIIGTYFTMYAKYHLKHEDVLRIQEYIQNNKVDFSIMKELHEIEEPKGKTKVK